MAWKKLSFCHKLKFSNSSIFATWLCKPFIFQTQTIKSNRIYSLKYQRSTISSCKDIGIRKSEFVAETRFLCIKGLELKKQTLILIKSIELLYHFWVVNLKQVLISISQPSMKIPVQNSWSSGNLNIIKRKKNV